jgi:hypothetical protein
MREMQERSRKRLKGSIGGLRKSCRGRWHSLLKWDKMAAKKKKAKSKKEKSKEERRKEEEKVLGC